VTWVGPTGYKNSCTLYGALTPPLHISAGAVACSVRWGPLFDQAAGRALPSAPETPGYQTCDSLGETDCQKNPWLLWGGQNRQYVDHSCCFSPSPSLRHDYCCTILYCTRGWKRGWRSWTLWWQTPSCTTTAPEPGRSSRRGQRWSRSLRLSRGSPRSCNLGEKCTVRWVDARRWGGRTGLAS